LGFFLEEIPKVSEIPGIWIEGEKYVQAAVLAIVIEGYF
jgi:hypothetical protein